MSDTKVDEGPVTIREVSELLAAVASAMRSFEQSPQLDGAARGVATLYRKRCDHTARRLSSPAVSSTADLVTRINYELGCVDSLLGVLLRRADLNVVERADVRSHRETCQGLRQELST